MVLPSPSSDPTAGFWYLLFEFLSLICTSILSAITGFYDLFLSCFTSYIDFELSMTKTIASLPPDILCMLFLLVLLVVNSALFWAWMLVKAALPWGHRGWKRNKATWGAGGRDLEADFAKVL
ncbi:hypothetical protein TrRE_jg6060 [Triparma retinervis]|uniref:Uncharacterized protein n=1 Tax=Triparma retinervis TaxID=2557542 RepID=A0A9W7CK81_9STRA|nr:hypothetical protein TrRE_jg6060 [Triparma retinervis]